MYVHYPALKPVLPANCTRSRLRAYNATPQLSDCRRIVAAHLRERGYSLKQIGIELNRHHTTIIHLLRSHEELMQSDAAYRARVESCGNLWKLKP